MYEEQESAAVVEPESLAIEESPSEPEPPALEPEPAIPVHPLANVFPMLDEDELRELADDIRENGLRHPIVRDTTGAIIDGRNRYAACKLAGIEPEFKTIDVDDVRAYIFGENISRRHLSKSQRAMAHALLYPEGENAKGGRGRKNSEVPSDFSGKLLQQARFVLRHAPDLVEKVLAGGVSLEHAHNSAREQVEAEEQYERLRLDVRDRLDAIAGICSRLASDIEKSSTVFLDQGDFVKQVRSDAEQIIEQAKELKESV